MLTNTTAPLSRLNVLLRTTAIVIASLLNSFVMQYLLEILLFELTVLIVPVWLVEGVRYNVKDV